MTEVNNTKDSLYQYADEPGTVNIDLLLASLYNNGVSLGVELGIKIIDVAEDEGVADVIITRDKMPFLFDLRRAKSGDE